MSWFQKFFKEAEDEAKRQEVDYFDLSEDFRSSPSQMSDFMASVMWMDIQDVIKTKIRSLRDDLEITSEHNDLIHLQGEIYSMKLMLDTPAKILQEIEMRIKEREEGND
jgi:hypothetical protein